MASREDKLKEYVKPLRRYALGILLYGSTVRGEDTERSDIDICVVAPDADQDELYKEILRLSSRDRYDIKVFERMPLFLKIEVIKNHRILYARNIYDLYEYFYVFRKIWGDQEYRQRLSKEELRDMFK